MGRRKINVNIGDVYGCYEVISDSYIKGEHSFVKVKCRNCGNVQDLAVSEITLRQKQFCQKCRGLSQQKYPDPQPGEIYNNWEIIQYYKYEKGFKIYKCKCTKCGNIQCVRKDQLVRKAKKCDNCKIIAKVKPFKKSNRSNNPFQTKVNRVIDEAALRSISVYFTADDLKNLYEKQNKRCALSGDFLPDIRKASIDRIDSSKPYTLDNIQIVTKEINLAKHVQSQQDFINMCKKVVDYANQQPSQELTFLEGSETNF